MSTMEASAEAKPVNWELVFRLVVTAVLVSLTLFTLVVAIVRPGGTTMNAALIFGAIAGCLAAFWGKGEENEAFTYTAFGSTVVVVFVLLFSATPAGVFLAALLSLLNVCMLDYSAVSEL